MLILYDAASKILLEGEALLRVWAGTVSDLFH